MKTKLIIASTAALLSLGGCFSTHYYVLSTASSPEQSFQQSQISIGIEKVLLPEYLAKRDIAVASTNNSITFLSDSWAESLEDGLSQRLVSFMQKKFNQPNVHLYPWGVDKQPDRKVRLAISRFISKGGYVYLEGNWEVENMHTKKHISKLFSIVLESSDDTEGIVASMDQAFAQLEESISKKIR